MNASDELTILSGKVLDAADDTIMIDPGIRVELPPDSAGGIAIGQRVFVRARRVRGRYVAESVRLEGALTGPRCRHCGCLLTRNDLENECEGCHRTNGGAAPVDG